MTDADFHRLSELANDIKKTSNRIEALINKKEEMIAEWKQLTLKLTNNEGTD